MSGSQKAFTTLTLEAARSSGGARGIKEATKEIAAEKDREGSDVKMTDEDRARIALAIMQNIDVTGLTGAARSFGYPKCGDLGLD